MGYYNNNKVGSIIRPNRGFDRKAVVLSDIGWHLAYNDGVDGYSAVYCNPPALPSESVDFIAGNDNIIALYIPTDVAEVKGMFQCFPNLQTIVVPNLSSIVVFPSNMITGTSVSRIVVPSGFLNDYKTRYPAWASLFDTWTATVDFTIPYIGNSTLTVSYIESVANILGSNISLVTNVTVPVQFTSYESGAIAKIEELFTNMEHLITCYEAGNMDLDMDSSIIDNIEAMGNTLDEALCYARQISAQYNGINHIYANDNALLILPPITGVQFSYYENRSFRNCLRLVYVANAEGFALYNDIGEPFNEATHLTEVHIRMKSGDPAANALNWRNMPSTNAIEVFDFNFTNGTQGNTTFKLGWWPSPDRLRSVLLNGLQNNLKLEWNSAASMTSQAYRDLFVSLGTPTTAKTIDIDSLSSSEKSKITDDILQLAYDKNWTISPTPSAFTLVLNNVNYQCDFGMTWAQWIASAYNTDGYYLDNGIVYESTGTNVVIESNGSIAMSGKMVRGGATYNVTSMPTLSTVTIPFSSNTTLTASAVNAYAETLANPMEVGKVIVPSDFTSYDTGSIDAILNAFVNISILECTYSGGTMDFHFENGSITKIDDCVLSTPISSSDADGYLVSSRADDVARGWIESQTTAFLTPAKFHYIPFVPRIDLTGMVAVAITNYGSNGAQFLYAPPLDLSGVTNMNFMFYSNLSGLQSATLLNCQSVTTWDEGFSTPSPSSISHLIIEGIKLGFNIANSNSLSRQALVDLFNSLGTPSTQQTLTIGATNLAKLTADDLAIATAKNWVVQ